VLAGFIYIDGACWNTQENTTDLPQETYTLYYIMGYGYGV
jgi:hypothetical protein